MAEIKARITTAQAINGNANTSTNIKVSGQTLTPITRQYEGLENDNTVVVVDNKENTIEVLLKNHTYATRFDFPNSGSESVLYIDESTNKVYRWSDKDLRYYVVGSDYTEIEIIYGGNADGECNAE